MVATANILEAAPDTRVALCHAGSPHDRSSQGLDSWAQNLRHLSTLPQVVCKLSGLGMFDHRWTNQTIAPLIDTCLDQFGPERCMFGSNFPVDSLYSDYATLAAAPARSCQKPAMPPFLEEPQRHSTASRPWWGHDYLMMISK